MEVVPVLRLIYLKDQLIKSIDAPANNIIPTERLFDMGGVIEVSYLKWLESYFDCLVWAV